MYSCQVLTNFSPGWKTVLSGMVTSVSNVARSVQLLVCVAKAGAGCVSVRAVGLAGVGEAAGLVAVGLTPGWVAVGADVWVAGGSLGVGEAWSRSGVLVANWTGVTVLVAGCGFVGDGCSSDFAAWQPLTNRIRYPRTIKAERFIG